MEFDLGLECITVSMTVGNWCLLGNIEQSYSVEVCRDVIMADINLEKKVGLDLEELWYKAKEIRLSLD